MPADEYDRAQLAALIARENDLEEALEEAREEVLLWAKRGRLAVKHGKQDLAREAKLRASAAKQRFIDTQAELNAIAGQKKRIRQQARRPDDQPTFQAEMLVEHFKLQGFDPVEQETKEIARRVEAGMELAALKGEPVEPAVASELEELKAVAHASTDQNASDDDIAALERELAALREGETKDRKDDEGEA